MVSEHSRTRVSEIDQIRHPCTTWELKFNKREDEKRRLMKIPGDIEIRVQFFVGLVISIFDFLVIHSTGRWVICPRPTLTVIFPRGPSHETPRQIWSTQFRPRPNPPQLVSLLHRHAVTRIVAALTHPRQRRFIRDINRCTNQISMLCRSALRGTTTTVLDSCINTNRWQIKLLQEKWFPRIRQNHFLRIWHRNCLRSSPNFKPKIRHRSMINLPHKLQSS